MVRHHPLYNASAGNHPLPSDRREIEAVLRAGRRCYETHPYLWQRYGARGEEFSRSDGGYLVTLASNPQSYVDSQVDWLGQVLANRGLPRKLLEDHLELLVEELTLAVPGREAKYRKLHRAAQNIRQAGQIWISQAQFNNLVVSFEEQAGVGLKGAGELLVAAVSDECCGMTKAVSSLVSWLGDAHRFTPQWCAAVNDTIARARIMAQTKIDAR